jgi:hypothetical protein
MLAALCVTLNPAAAADRQVAWIVAADGALERQLNTLAARGLRLAAVSDGLPAPVAVMQAPESEGGAVEYRVATHRELTTTLPALVDEGYVPVAALQRAGSRTHVVFERAGRSRDRDGWRLVEFADLDGLEAALAAVAAEGYRARLLVHAPLKSWPGLSHSGLLLASRPPEAGTREARDVRVVINRSRGIEDTARAVEAAAAEGFGADVLFTTGRDGSLEARRERLVIVMSRARGATAPAAPIRLERTSSFGIFGSGRLLGATRHWAEDYVYTWTPEPRRQIWASPIRLSESEAKGFGLDVKLRVDGDDESAWDIVGLIARPVSAGQYELCVLTDQHLGPKPGR